MDRAPRLLKKRWALAAIFFGMLAGMMIFEVTKQMIFPEISLWESHVITIIFTSIMGVVIAYYPLRAMQVETKRAILEANRKLNLLSDITRHDILNQLLVLSGYVTLLQGGTSSPEEQQFLSRCETAVNTIQSQITFTRDYQDIGIQAPEWQNIGEILEGVKERFTLGNVTLTNVTENVEILADHLLEKVFYNLVDNSLRYAGPGLTSIRVSTGGKLPDGSLHCLLG